MSAKPLGPALSATDRVLFRATAADVLRLPLRILNLHVAIGTDLLMPTVVERYDLPAYATLVAIIAGYPLRDLPPSAIKVTTHNDTVMLHYAGSDDEAAIHARTELLARAYLNERRPRVGQAQGDPTL